MTLFPRSGACAVTTSTIEVFGDDMQSVEISLDPAFHKRFGAGFFGGEGSILGNLGDLLDGDG